MQSTNLRHDAISIVLQRDEVSIASMVVGPARRRHDGRLSTSNTAFQHPI